jgi:hypothetical protein
MIKQILGSLLIIFGFTNHLSAQSTPEEITNQFFSIYKNQSSDKAIDYLFSTNKSAKDDQTAIDSLKKQVNTAAKVIGKFESFELILRKEGGHSVLALTYIVNFENEPVTFRIFLYKPQNTWQVQTFKFNDSIYDELEESSKLHNN